MNETIQQHDEQDTTIRTGLKAGDDNGSQMGSGTATGGGSQIGTGNAAGGFLGSGN
jgi:hypothetical protein